MIRLGVIFAVFMAVFTPATHTSAETIKPPPVNSGWLETLNYYRLSSNLNTVVEDPTITDGAQKHATYLARSDKKYLSGKYANLHTENPASPFFTQEGTEIGAGDITTGVDSTTRSIDQLMTAPFHAIGLLRENLERVGMGTEVIGPHGYSPGSRITNIGVLAGLNSSDRTKTILFPGPGAITYLNDFTGENPEPRESCGRDYKLYKGLIIFASLLSSPVVGLKATLTDPKNQLVTEKNLCIVTEDNFTSSDPIYGEAGQQIIAADHLVMLIPRNPLAPGKYQVSILQAGQEDLKWNFTYVEGTQRVQNKVTVTYPRANKKVYAGEKVLFKIANFEGKFSSSISNSNSCVGTWTQNTLVVQAKKAGSCTVSLTGTATNFVSALKERYVITVTAKK